MLLFLYLQLSFLDSVLYVYALFLFSFKIVLQNCHIVLYECLCFYLFVVCQNEDLKHVAVIVTRFTWRKCTSVM